MKTLTNFILTLVICSSVCISCGDKDDTISYSGNFDYTLQGIGGTAIATGKLSDLEFNKKSQGGLIVPVYFVGTATNQFIFQIFGTEVGSFLVDTTHAANTAAIVLKSPSLSEPVHFTEGVLHLQQIKTGAYPDGEIQGYFEAKTELYPGDTVYVDGFFERHVN